MSVALAAPSAASVDRLRAGDAPLALQAALVVGTALLTGLLAQFELRVYLWEVPLTLQSIAVYGAGLFLGWRTGALAMLLYLALGLVLPMYAGGGSGLASAERRGPPTRTGQHHSERHFRLPRRSRCV